MDNIIQIEIALNFLNDLFAKSVAFNDKLIINELNIVRHNIYYGDFNYDSIIKKLSVISERLRKYA